MSTINIFVREKHVIHNQGSRCLPKPDNGICIALFVAASEKLKLQISIYFIAFTTLTKWKIQYVIIRVNIAMKQNEFS